MRRTNARAKFRRHETSVSAFARALAMQPKVLLMTTTVRCARCAHARHLQDSADANQKHLNNTVIMISTMSMKRCCCRIAYVMMIERTGGYGRRKFSLSIWSGRAIVSTLPTMRTTTICAMKYLRFLYEKQRKVEDFPVLGRCGKNRGTSNIKKSS